MLSGAKHPYSNQRCLCSCGPSTRIGIPFSIRVRAGSRSARNDKLTRVGTCLADWQGKSPRILSVMMSAWPRVLMCESFPDNFLQRGS
jgi:hypothetical protein